MDPIGTAGTGGITAATPLRVFLSHTSDLGDSLAIRERLAAADPGNAAAQRDLSVSYNKLGDLMVRVGNGPEAERLFRDSLAITERLAAADPLFPKADPDRPGRRLRDLRQAGRGDTRTRHRGPRHRGPHSSPRAAGL